MTTIAEQVKAIAESREYGAISFYAGQAQYLEGGGFKTVRFPGWHEEKKRVNDKGRTTYALGRYSDNSTLEYRWSENGGMKLKAEEGKP